MSLIINELLKMGNQQKEKSSDLAHELNLKGYSIEMMRVRDYEYAETEELFQNLYKKSIIDQYFWQYCPFEVYKNTFDKRKEQYFEKYQDAKLKDFLKYEYQQISNSFRDRKFYLQIYGYNINDRGEKVSKVREIDLSFLSNSLLTKIYYSQERKKEYLLESGLDRNLIDTSTQNNSDTLKDIFLDYSDNKQNERVVFLHELGILDYLEDKMKKELHYFNPNKLAEIVSTFTGVSYGTVISYINPIYSNRVSKKNNPLTPKNIKQVKEKLNNIGITNTKSR